VRTALIELDAHYTIADENNRGANGYTFFAQNRVTDQQVVIKFYSDSGAARHDEPRLLAGIRSDNVLRILDARVVSEEWAYFVTPLCDGGDLDDWISTGPSAIASIDAVLHICSGVTAIHAAGLVHRDLKPGNIVVESGTPLIADFGSVRALSPGGTGVHASGHSILYRPPECFGDGTYTIGGDLYQVGLIAYQLMGGTLPYEGTQYFGTRDVRDYRAITDTVEQSIFVDRVIQRHIQNGSLVNYSSLPPWFRQPATPTLRRLLSVDPSRRPNTAADVVADLLRLRGRIADWRWIGDTASLVSGNRRYEIRPCGDGLYEAFSVSAGRVRRIPNCEPSDLTTLVERLSE
jgi:serine/threonine protein kinase